MIKRTKQVQIMIDEMNARFKALKVIDQFDSEFMLFQHLLLTANCYRGFNWYYDVECIDLQGNKKVGRGVCGTSDYEKIKSMDGYIQFI